MGDQRDGGIAWTDESWNPIRGCSRISPGCQHCYAERVAGRFSGPGQPYEGLVRLRVTGKHGRPQWNGAVRMVPEHLDDPLRWRRPRRVFVNSMSDLFHESLSNEQIAAVFGVMAAAPQHTFQVLTKRANRMSEWFAWAASADVNATVRCCSDAETSLGRWLGTGETRTAAWQRPWPLPNVWLGVSCEDQQRADERIPHLLDCPAAVRWVSLEPQIGPVDLSAYMGGPYVALPGDVVVPSYNAGLGWIVVGGESGPGARPFDLAWARAAVEACRAAGVPCFVKQLGARVRADEWGPGKLPQPSNRIGARSEWVLGHSKGGDPAEWPEDLRVREWPEVPHA